MKIKKSKYTIGFNIIAYIIVTIATLICIIPFWLIISGSFTDNESIMTDGYRLIPKVFSVTAYKTIFQFPEGILKAYAVTTVNMVVGTSLGLFFMSMAGYVLSRKYFKYRNRISFLIYFTTIFGGGLIPWYVTYVKYLHLKDSYLALCIPMLMSPFLIILIRTFIQSSVPDEIVESAKIDGAGEFKIYSNIVLPVSIPGLATVGLFLALGYWNDWFLSSVFITTQSKYELQFYLYNMLSKLRAMLQLSSKSGVSIPPDLPTESTKLAMAVVVTGPIILLYPFVQRYFVTGITIGAVKG